MYKIYGHPQGRKGQDYVFYKINGNGKVALPGVQMLKGDIKAIKTEVRKQGGGVQAKDLEDLKFFFDDEIVEKIKKTFSDLPPKKT